MNHLNLLIIVIICSTAILGSGTSNLLNEPTLSKKRKMQTIDTPIDISALKGSISLKKLQEFGLTIEEYAQFSKEYKENAEEALENVRKKIQTNKKNKPKKTVTPQQNTMDTYFLPLI